jgi:hypothetical protein
MPQPHEVPAGPFCGTKAARTQRPCGPRELLEYTFQGGSVELVCRGSQKEPSGVWPHF